MGSLARVIAAAKSRNMGYFAYLAELKQARKEFGHGAANFQVALDLAFMEAQNKKKKA